MRPPRWYCQKRSNPVYCFRICRTRRLWYSSKWLSTKRCKLGRRCRCSRSRKWVCKAKGGLCRRRRLSTKWRKRRPPSRRTSLCCTGNSMCRWRPPLWCCICWICNNRICNLRPGSKSRRRSFWIYNAFALVCIGRTNIDCQKKENWSNCSTLNTVNKYSRYQPPTQPSITIWEPEYVTHPLFTLEEEHT